jgi:ferredoxin-2, mitochondrial
VRTTTATSTIIARNFTTSQVKRGGGGDVDWLAAQPSKQVSITFVDIWGDRATVKASVGETLLAAARRSNVDIIGQCDGRAGHPSEIPYAFGPSCDSCHMYIPMEIATKVPPATDMENDMFLFNPDKRSNSRLGCQVLVDDNMDNMVVSIVPPRKPYD